MSGESASLAEAWDEGYEAAISDTEARSAPPGPCGPVDPTPNPYAALLAARQESLAERVKALADEWERHHATCDDCTGDYLSAARELRRALLDPSETGGGRRDG